MHVQYYSYYMYVHKMLLNVFLAVVTSLYFAISTSHSNCVGRWSHTMAASASPSWEP